MPKKYDFLNLFRSHPKKP